MIRFRRVPLAWKNLTHDVRRLAAAVGGITFAVVLMFMQFGFRNALIDSTVKVIHDLNADILLVSKGQYAMPAQQRFRRSRLYTALECPGVASISPLYIETYGAELRRRFEENGRVTYGKGYPIRVLAFELGDDVLAIAGIDKYQQFLRRPDTALIDTKSKVKFGVAGTTPNELASQPVRLAGREVDLVGSFTLGTDFANDGNLIMSAHNFSRYFPYRAGQEDPLSLVDIGAVRIEPGADIIEVKHRLQDILSPDVAVHTKQEFIQYESTFWRESTPIGYIFNIGTVMGFVVGVIICYQIIYSNIADHMAEFATLKAMGYANRYFITVVLFESFYLSLLGFAPGWFISFVLYQALAEMTGLLMILGWGQALMVYLLTLAMCGVSGTLAMRKVLGADPAELF